MRNLLNILVIATMLGIGFCMAAYLGKYIPIRETPCTYYAKKPLSHVPARCLKYFQEQQ